MDKQNFYQEKYEYYRTLNLWAVFGISIPSIGYFFSDCYLLGGFSTETLISRSAIIIPFQVCITKISTFLILCDLAVCLATLYVSFSLVFALMRYLQGKVFLIRFYSPTTLSSSRAEFRLPSRLACA